MFLLKLLLYKNILKEDIKKKTKKQNSILKHKAKKI